MSKDELTKLYEQKLWDNLHAFLGGKIDGFKWQGEKLRLIKEYNKLLTKAI